MNYENPNDAYIDVFKAEIKEYIKGIEDKYEYTEEFPSEYDLFIRDGANQYASLPFVIYIKNRRYHTRKMQPYTARSKIG